MTEAEITEVFWRAHALVRRKVGDPGCVVLEVHRDGLYQRSERCEQDVLRTRNPPVHRPRGTPFGLTVLSRSGVLVLISSLERHLEQLAGTCVHELVHCVQLNRPGARAQMTAWLRNNYALGEMTERQARQANSLIECREKEAERWERRLTTKLMRGV